MLAALSSMITRYCCANGTFSHHMAFGHFLPVTWRWANLQ
nr:hypothetical protein Iba_scaffold7995CG0010 [Ipomoea batatas]